MKKFINFVFLFTITLLTFAFVGCGNGYNNLYMYLSFSYSSDEIVEEFSNGTIRVKTSTSTFDVRADGSYIFYITQNQTSSAKLNVTFSNAPKDFTYSSSLSPTNEIISIGSGSKIDNGYIYDISFNQSGSTKIVASNLDSGKKQEIYIDIVEIPSSINFINNNLALPKVNDFEINLTDEISYNSSNISFEFGYYGASNEFIAFADYNQLIQNGFEFNQQTNVLSVLDKDNIKLTSFVVKAIYDNPIGDDIIAFTTIKILPEIRNIEVYKASSILDVVDSNKISSLEFVTTLNGIKYNYRDIAIKVESNYENVSFDFFEKDSSLFPFVVTNLNVNDNSNIVYLDDNGAVCDSYSDAKYTCAFYRLSATKTNTTLDKYEDYIYNLTISCNYADYIVPNYPIYSSIETMCYALIKNFSINEESKTSLIFDNTLSTGYSSFFKDNDSKFYKYNLYKNTDDGILGQAFKIDDQNNDTILENSRFSVEFYEDITSSINKIENPLHYFEFSYLYNGDVIKIDDYNVLNRNVFNKGTTIYLKTKDQNISRDSVYYMVIRAEKPSDDILNQTVAVVKLTIQEGIESFDNFNYTYLSYELNEQDEYDVVEKTHSNISFDEVKASNELVMFVSNEPIELDYNLMIGNSSLINLFFTPIDSNLENLSITSTNSSIFDIDYNLGTAEFRLIPKKAGNAQIKISSSNLAYDYYIDVNIYTPVEFLYLSLNQQSVDEGVGHIENSNLNTTSAIVKNDKLFSFSKLINNDASEYETIFTVYYLENGQRVQIDSQVLDENLLSQTIFDEYFFLNLKNLTFSFSNCENREYVVNITIKNLNGKEFVREVALSSYYPIDEVTITSTTSMIINPHSVYFEDKVLSTTNITVNDLLLDPSIFGLNVTHSNSPTFNFNNYGKLEIYINNDLMISYSVKNGYLYLDSESKDNCITLIAEGINGNYWFRLNEDYDYNTASIIIRVSISEFDYVFSRETKIVVNNPTSVNRILSSVNEVVHLRQGINTNRDIKLEISNDKAENKDIIVKNFVVVEVDGNYYYALINQNSSIYQTTLTKTSNNVYNLNININDNYYGQVVSVVLPEDRVNYESDYSLINGYTYREVNITSNQFVYGLYYYLDTSSDENNYILETNFREDRQYYIQSADFENILTLWDNVVVIEFIISDGTNIAFYITSLQELMEISQNKDLSSKKYVLTRDIYASNDSWTPIGNYYKANVNEQNFLLDTFYNLDNDGNYIVATEFDADAVYYAFGFNGTLSGKYEIFDSASQSYVTKYYGIYELKANLSGQNENIGLFTKIGFDGEVSDLIVNYSAFQLSETQLLNNVIFGGISSVNYGIIKNVDVNYNEFRLSSNYNIIFGGVSGKNYGDILNDDINSSHIVKGNVTISSTNVDASVSVGGYVGENYGLIKGIYNIYEEIEYSFEDASFNSSLNINVLSSKSINDISDENFFNHKIGGVSGYSNGEIQNIAVQGKIIAQNSNNVGGLVGYLESKQSTEQLTYKSILNSYSIVNITGANYVGGAVGGIFGSDTNKVNLYNVSSENYVLGTQLRTFVNGNMYVGGFAGYAQMTNIEYSYAVSYFECNLQGGSLLDRDLSYDVVGNSIVSGFIAYVKNSNISKSASYLNIKGNSSVKAFIAYDSSLTISDVYYVGSIYANNIENESSFNNNSYYIIYDVLKNTFKESSKNVSGSWWKVEENGEVLNEPYLIFDDGTPLFANSTLQVTATVKDVETPNYVNYVKINNNSVMLFYAYDSVRDLYSEVDLLNLINVLDFLNLEVIVKTHKTARLTLSSSDTSVLSILENGSLKINGQGRTKLTISSKLNSNYKAEIEVFVVFGINDIKLYADSYELDYEQTKDTIILNRNNNVIINIESSYNREIDNNVLSLQPYDDDIGIRFIVYNDDNLQNILANVSQEQGESKGINDLFKISSSYNQLQNWAIDTANGYYYVDIIDSRIQINPLLSFDGELSVYYIPYLSTVQGTKTFLNLFGTKSFKITIINGAREIKFENNIASSISINQLETFAVTVTVLTDYENEDILTNLNSILDENLGYNIAPIIYNRDSQNNLVSISRTYTFWYKDKVNPILETKNYSINFWAVSNFSEDNKKELSLSITGYQNLNSVNAEIYSEVSSDFPQNPSVNKIIYNGKTALLSIEVYPFFVDFSQLRISYTSTTNHSMLISQLKYNIQGTSDKFSIYGDSGAYLDGQNRLIVPKSSAQDTYLINNNGIYSYSRSYFFGLMISSAVPDGTIYQIMIEVLNKQGQVLRTELINVSTLAKASLTLSFDESLKENNSTYSQKNNIYYLPYNTKQKLNVETTSQYSKINWVIDSPDYELSYAEKEVLTPVYENGNWYVYVMNYGESTVKANTDLIGKTITIKATLDDGETADPYTIKFVVTLFTVVGISIEGENDGYLSLPNYTTIPLKVNLTVKYDETILQYKDSWYSSWYNNYTANNEEDSLYNNIVNAGFTVQESFVNYFSLLKESIEKANYDTSNITNKKSGVFISKNDNSYLTSSNEYNNGAYSVQNYNEYIAINGYRTDINSQLSFIVYMNYSYEDNNLGISSSGLPNVKDYNVNSFKYSTPFVFESDFVLTFYDKIEFKNAIPVSNAQEFVEMQNASSDQSYRLINNIVLSDYTPIDANMYSFDGNGFTIYITSFSSSILNNTEQELKLGLFDQISEDTLIYNTSVFYASSVDDDFVPKGDGIKINLVTDRVVKFGGLAIENNGVITNSLVSGTISLSIKTTTNDNISNAGFVLNNNSTGYITYSKVKNFNITCYGVAGGFVSNNKGKIVSSSFDISTIENLSNGNVGGFVLENDGEIYECFSQGIRNSSDVDIRNRGKGIASFGGRIGGFAYKNTNIISDCYSNILTSSSGYRAGFAYEETSSSVISRCYSICYNMSDENKTTAFAFIGPVLNQFVPRVVVNGVLNNCYFLTTGIEGENQIFYDSDDQTKMTIDETKMAVGLTFDDFATHSSFINYDLSLVYSSARYADNSTYNYVDGYTWVIIEGKPVLASSLVNTISQQEYLGKVKNYSSETTYYSQTNKNIKRSSPVTIGAGQEATIRYDYYNGEINESNLLFSTYTKDSTNEVRFVFYSNSTHEEITVVCQKNYNEDTNEFYLTPLNAEIGNDSKQVLDIIVNEDNNLTENDKNFRANDTLCITFGSLTFGGDESLVISEIKYKKLESASYYYSSNVTGVSDVLGSRTNPEIIFDYESFNSLLSDNTENKFYRIVSDIDLEDRFVSTSSKTFKGVLQGNYMSVDNLSISYLNSDVSSVSNKEAFGLFAEISVSNESSFNTVISNLDINVKEVISTIHNFVGALAGRIDSKNSSGITNSNQRIFLNNVNVRGSSDVSYGLVQGKNAVGGLAGIALGYVVIKNIEVDVRVNASYDEAKNKNSSMLYLSRDTQVLDENNESQKQEIANNSKNISYAGGVVGIFDVEKIIDPATQRNYNANNITVVGKNTYSGNIVGMAFGLVGELAIVNYVNVVVENKVDTFIKSTTYGGGIVGENRGVILSSSINYENDDNNTNGIATSTFTEYELFYNNEETVAIGGLVGLNNGGFIQNSISNIFVRSVNASIAGGAVGRMLEGGLLGVVATGSVLSNNIIGGLIGTLNDYDIIVGQDGNYSKLAINKFDKDIYKEITGYEISDNSKVTTIVSNCVAGNNYLSQDYNTYDVMINNNRNAVAGFIGLIATYSSSSSFNEETLNKFEFTNKSYYSNAIYKNASDLSNPDIYLPATYYSKDLDYMNINSQSEPAILVDSSGEQVVFPYTMSEFYYEAIPTTISYRINSVSNPNYIETKDSNHDKYMSRIYTITYASLSSIYNDSSFFSLIDYDVNGNWATEYKNRDYKWYEDRFGKIYKFDEATSTYSQILKEDFDIFYAPIDGVYPNVYYISTVIVDKFIVDETFVPIQDDVRLYGTTIQNNIINDYTFESLTDIKNQKYIYINGITYPIDFNNIDSSSNEDYDGESSSGSYVFNCDYVLPNNSVVSKIVINIKKYVTTSSIYYKIENVILTYLYDDIGLLDDQSYYGLMTNTVVANTEFNLKILSKKVIYKSFENDYWLFKENFYTDNVSIMDKYPINVEEAKNYVWTDFKTTIDFQDEVIDGVNYKKLYVNSAEQLAYLAYLVNTQNIFASEISSGALKNENIIVELNSDIDLSGKYWEPIGTEEHPFRFVFNGNGKTIKYVSVNEKSFDSQDKTQYAGLFGVIENAKIYNLNISGGEVSWENAGGLVGKAIDSEIHNITNRNNVNGIIVAGGIVGESINSNIYACYNYANVNNIYSTGDNREIYVGGIVAKMSGGKFGKDNTLTQTTTQNTYFGAMEFRLLNNQIVGQNEEQEKLSYVNVNFGEILVSSSLNSYLVDNCLYKIYVGGLIGSLIDVNVITNLDTTDEKVSFDFDNKYHTNAGNISVSTNAHELFVGGVVGYASFLEEITTRPTLSQVKNFGDISIIYSNNYTSTKLDDEFDSNASIVGVGGVVGISQLNLSCVSNLGNITFDFITANDGIVGLSGVVGIAYNSDGLEYLIRESYSSADISVSSTSRTEFGIGGISGIIDLSSLTVENITTSVLVNIKDCYNTGNIYAGNNSSTSLGGIAGFVRRSNELGSAVLIQNTLNIGSVTIYNIQNEKKENALGSIIGNIDLVYVKNPYANLNPEKPEDYVPEDLFNYYLSGSAFSGNSLYTSYSVISSDGFEPISDDDKFAVSKISDSLKKKSSYELVRTDGSQQGETDDKEYVWDFDNVWTQLYDTWYPTLINNNTTSLWEDKQEEIYTSSNYYEISSAGELAYVASQINSGSIDSKDKVFELTNYIDLSNNYWTPIGSQEYPFKGTFNGNGYVIKNLTINGSVNGNLNEETEFGALFGYVEDAVIEKVSLESPIITNVNYAAGIAYSVTNSRVENVYTDCVDSSDSIILGRYGAGGLIYNLRNSSYDENQGVQNGLYLSYNNTPVSYDVNYEGISIIGGLVGNLENSFISNCYNSYDAIITINIINQVDASITADAVALLGKINDSSKVENVFNLSPMVGESELTPMLYDVDINEQGTRGKFQSTGKEPKIENLSNSVMGNVVDIWTSEYSLNKGNYSVYPTIRGLGNEWKNVDSDALVRFTYSSFNDMKNAVVDYLETTYGENSTYSNVSFARENTQSANATTTYLISSANELAWVSNNINSGNLLSSNCEFILVNDIDLTGKYWTPIGINQTYAFNGIFNFNGHIIKGLTIDSLEYSSAGLFGFTNNALIINGYILDAFIKVNNSNSNIYAGTLAGYVSNTTIKNISVTTAMSIHSLMNVYVGGLVGYVRGSNYYISNIYVNSYNKKDDNSLNSINLGSFANSVVEVENGTITENSISIGAFTESGEVYLGGAIGYIIGYNNEEKAYFSYVNTNINIAGVSYSNSYNVYAGGLIGYGSNYVKVDGSKSSGITKTNSSKFDVVGGLVGYLYNGIITNSLFDGYIESKQNQTSLSGGSQNIRGYVGGIVGGLEGNSSAIQYCSVLYGKTISNSQNSYINVGAIIGLARNRDFILDTYAVFDSVESKGFVNSVGIIENSINDDTIEKVFVKDSSYMEQFDANYWEDTNLISNMTYVLGFGYSSFGASLKDDTSKNLLDLTDTNPGLLASDLKDIKLSFDGTVKNSQIGIVLVVKENDTLTYKYVQSELTKNQNILISDFVQISEDVQIVACFITLI